MSSYNIPMIFAALIFASTVWAQADLAEFLTEVSVLDNDDVTTLDEVPGDDEGVAFPPWANAIITVGLPEEDAANRSPEAADLALLGKPAADRPTFELVDPINMAVDPTREAPFLVVIEENNLLSLIIKTPAGDLNPNSITGGDAARLPDENREENLLENPQGMTFDGRTLYLVDNGPVLIACGIGALRAGPAFKRAVERANCVVSSMEAVVDGGRPRGIAFNPQDGLLYLFIPNKEEIVRMTTTGGLVDRHEVQDLDTTDLKGATFARSSDATDAEGNFNLFVVTGGTETGEHTEWTLATTEGDERTERTLAQ